jgi:hypothetical protein
MIHHQTQGFHLKPGAGRVANRGFGSGGAYSPSAAHYRVARLLHLRRGSGPGGRILRAHKFGASAAVWPIVFSTGVYKFARQTMTTVVKCKFFNPPLFTYRM